MSTRGKSKDVGEKTTHRSLREQLPANVAVRLADELAEWVPAPVFIVSPDGGVVCANAAARALPTSALTHHPSGQLIESTGYSLVIIGDGQRTSSGRIAQAAAEWSLTDRQKQVLPLVLAGLSNKEIATHLAISLRTAESHVTGILAKAMVDSRARLLHLLWSCFALEETATPQP